VVYQRILELYDLIHDEDYHVLNVQHMINNENYIVLSSVAKKNYV